MCSCLWLQICVEWWWWSCMFEYCHLAQSLFVCSHHTNPRERLILCYQSQEPPGYANQIETLYIFTCAQPGKYITIFSVEQQLLGSLDDTPTLYNFIYAKPRNPTAVFIKNWQIYSFLSDIGTLYISSFSPIKSTYCSVYAKDTSLVFLGNADILCIQQGCQTYNIYCCA